ncbi:mediator of RNA polymerase II transcription subunit 4-like protein [Euroglyphus maynei]|uniref:Mediator of RNA polymerase II transcription subunit 4 n=1 Tax=Euroglyphus maynei TaxID=6958 RepID=A0A1Y3BQZ2_EURMA|nr:mediator of RNA polymerase II transcription subunit 4-like protein [Euroglyphus maynei]
MFEHFLLPKSARSNLVDRVQLAELLVRKDQELRQAMKAAEEQELIQSKIEQLRREVQDHDEELQKLQQSFKEAESILSTAIYQAKQKLSLIKKADSHPISIDELIKYAHKISADHSVASPYNWEIGDQRRPYPTDLEMKSGLLVNSNDANLSSLLQQQQQQQYHQNQLQEQSSIPMRPSSASSSPYSWANQQQQQQFATDTKPNINSGGYGDYSDVKTQQQRDNDEVEVMSTDSSSTSSSDSQ